jgi:hypothetical protein
MPSSHITRPACLWFSHLAAALGPRSASRFVLLLVGAVLARGRRAVTTCIRAGLSHDFRPCYTTVSAAGRNADAIAARLAGRVVRPLVADSPRVVLALDDTPTPRSGRHVQGAGIHHNPTPGPTGSPFVYGHGWVVLGLLATHPRGAFSPSPCSPGCTCGGRTSTASRSTTAPSSAPSSSWPSSCSAGRRGGSDSWGGRCGW